jgi:aspartate aminotransferase-like enzyme
LRTTDWSRKFDRVRQHSRALRVALARHGLTPLAGADMAAPGVFTLAIDPDVAAGDVAGLLLEEGIEVGFQSAYLRHRNWLQIALMGEVNEPALRRLPALLAAAIKVSPGGRPAPASRHHPFEPEPAPKPARPARPGSRRPDTGCCG